MTRTSIYLDHNATTPLRPEAAAAVAAAQGVVGNPSSVHGFGRAARRVIEDAREQVAALVAAPPASVIFTSGGTEANTLALHGTERRRVLVSAVEHASVLEVAADAERIPVDRDGVVDLDALAAVLVMNERPALVSVMLANNETGVIQPVAAVAEVAARHGALVHCDAVQAAGKIRVDPAALGVHLLSLSAHKLGGPPGVGALIVNGTDVEAQLVGGGQERRRRAGTENIAGIAGFGAAAAAVGVEAAQRAAAARTKALRGRLEAGVMAATPSARVIAADAERLVNTVCILTPGVPAETLVMALDLAGVAVSAGSACSSGKVAGSHVLRAMGLGEHLARQAVRVSLGWTTTEREIDDFVTIWRATAGRLCAGFAMGATAGPAEATAAA
ncbi:MAG: cysteine desulfurase [Rhodospirillales bacterium]|nr:cysteine desulfurase [Rhodospirillales bacterium]